MPGVHYAENALGALCVADFLGVPFAQAGEALANFQGVDRRFSVRGEAGGVLVVDDYGHHPTELAATIAAARLHGRRLLVAFQPHRYTRTRDLLADFAPALAGAAEVILTDVYPAGESPIPGADAHALLATFPAGAAVHHVARPALTGALVAAARPGDLILCLGAGDITAVPGELLAALAQRGVAP
jgi:UDP-N-acetylmuramate--alanine ligase